MRPPLEECQGAAGVLRGGGTSTIIDAQNEKLSDQALLARIAQFEPDLVVCACTFGSLDADLAWVKKIKHQFPAAVTALRGAPCYVWSSDLLARTPELDLCVRGDYELVFESLAAKGFAAQGITFREPDGTYKETAAPRAPMLDDLPLPDRTSINQKLYTVRGTGSPQATIHVQRGCPFPCTFCLVHTVTGSRARHRSPASIVSEVQQLMATGVRHFYLRAETFTLDRRWAIAVSTALAGSCPGIRWVTATRAECVDEVTLAAMRQAGCYGISFGIDVASEAIGKHVQKRPQFEAACSAMRLCDRHGIISLAYIMLGFLWETPETLRQAAAFIHGIRPDLVTVHFAHPYPGTAYANAVKEAGFQVISPHAQAQPALALPQLSPHELRWAARKLLMTHYIRPAVLRSLVTKGLSAYLMPRLRPHTRSSPEAASV